MLLVLVTMIAVGFAAIHFYRAWLIEKIVNKMFNAVTLAEPEMLDLPALSIMEIKSKMREIYSKNTLKELYSASNITDDQYKEIAKKVFADGK